MSTSERVALLLINVSHCFLSKIDISSEFSFGHMLQFSKLAAAFAIEVGELED